MRIPAFFFLIVTLNSCFLFSDFKKSRFVYSENGTRQSIDLVVPKKFVRSESRTDSSGNQERYFHYRDGAVLYFVQMKDTLKEYQPIDYTVNIPKEIYQTRFFKGFDSTNHYWRETRFGNFKTGYFKVDEDDDGIFDSSLNYFSLHARH